MEEKIEIDGVQTEYLPSDKYGSQFAQFEKIAVGRMVTVYTRDNANTQPQPVKARVVYVHPEKRFYVVEYDSGVRESFIWGCAS